MRTSFLLILSLIVADSYANCYRDGDTLNCGGGTYQKVRESDHSTIGQSELRRGTPQSNGNLVNATASAASIKPNRKSTKSKKKNYWSVFQGDGIQIHNSRGENVVDMFNGNGWNFGPKSGTRVSMFKGDGIKVRQGNKKKPKVEVFSRNGIRVRDNKGDKVVDMFNGNGWRFGSKRNGQVRMFDGNGPRYIEGSGMKNRKGKVKSRRKVVTGDSNAGEFQARPVRKSNDCQESGEFATCGDDLYSRDVDVYNLKPSRSSAAITDSNRGFKDSTRNLRNNSFDSQPISSGSEVQLSGAGARGL